MNRPIILLSLLFLAPIAIQAQLLQRSMLAQSGNSNRINKGRNAYYVSQSIGQQSVIGTFTSNHFAVGQGFQQSTVRVEPIAQEKTLKVSVYPNPVESIITIKLNDDVLDETLSIVIYNLSGAVVYQENRSISNSLQVSMEHFVSGVYLLTVNSGYRSYSARIIKD